MIQICCNAGGIGNRNADGDIRSFVNSKRTRRQNSSWLTNCNA